MITIIAREIDTKNDITIINEKFYNNILDNREAISKLLSKISKLKSTSMDLKNETLSLINHLTDEKIEELQVTRYMFQGTKRIPDPDLYPFPRFVDASRVEINNASKEIQDYANFFSNTFPRYFKLISYGFDNISKDAFAKYFERFN